MIMMRWERKRSKLEKNKIKLEERVLKLKFCKMKLVLRYISRHITYMLLSLYDS